MKNEFFKSLISKSSILPSVMIVGSYTWPWYQEACFLALEKIGCNVVRFSWFNDFQKHSQNTNIPTYHSFWHRLEYKFHFGPIVNSINKRLINFALRKKPDVIWFYNVQIISPKTLIELKKNLPNTIFAQYANDNPFSPYAKKSMWKNFLESIALFDIHFVYRLSNLNDYKKFNTKNVHLLRSYFIPEEDFPEETKNIPDRFQCDVVFAGHYENDGRIEILEKICNQGYKLNIFGGGWEKAFSELKPNSPLRNFFPIYPVIKDEYRYAICGAKVALCFLSKLNQDTYTRRNFQIPAMKTAMLSEWSEDLSTLFINGKECEFFKDSNELLKKLAKLLSDENHRKNIALSGYNKVYKDGHDTISRMQFLLKKIFNLKTC